MARKPGTVSAFCNTTVLSRFDREASETKVNIPIVIWRDSSGSRKMKRKSRKKRRRRKRRSRKRRSWKRLSRKRRIVRRRRSRVIVRGRRIFT